MATFYHPVMAIFIIKIVRITIKMEKKNGERERGREGGRERERRGGESVCEREREGERRG